MGDSNIDHVKITDHVFIFRARDSLAREFLNLLTQEGIPTYAEEFRNHMANRVRKAKETNLI